MKRRASKELVQRVNEVFNRLRNETDVYDDDDAGAPDQSSFITRVLETVGLKPKQAVNKVEDKVEAKYNNKYSLLLNFYKADDAAQFHAFMKNKVYPPIFWFFFVLVGGIDMSRISLTQMFKEGPWLKVTGAISVAAIVAFFIFAVSTFSRITYNVFGEDMWLERVCRAVATGFFRGYIEDVITVLFALALSSYLVARVVQGPCSDDGSARAYIDCNPLAEVAADISWPRTAATLHRLSRSSPFSPAHVFLAGPVTAHRHRHRGLRAPAGAAKRHQGHQQAGDAVFVGLGDGRSVVVGHLLPRLVRHLRHPRLAVLLPRHVRDTPPQDAVVPANQVRTQHREETA
jgi:hypothetical protein